MRSLKRRGAARRPHAGTAARHDPAPSRWSYRLQRWMLTPMFRSVLRLGLPAAVCVGAGLAFFSDAERREAIAQTVAEIREQIETRPEFMVNLLAIDGAGAVVEAEIRELFPHDLPASSFEVDLAAVRRLIVDLPAVAEASVRLRQGGVLLAEVTERQPAALWRSRRGLLVVDATGVVIGQASRRAAKPDLPVIAGDGATAAVAEALDIFAAAESLGTRVRGLVRIGERRWNVVLDRDQTILLPETRAVRALERVIVLGDLQDLLERDVAVVDMRLSARPTIRLSNHAVTEWWRITQTDAGPEPGLETGAE
ncbi:MAG: cell division protein FtsQ/DivIB [Pseudomonadota bacterium]